jgi:hypothetical protein
MDRSTQENAALVEEAAAAAASLQEQATRLAQAASRFRLGHTQAVAPVAPVRAAPRHVPTPAPKRIAAQAARQRPAARKEPELATASAGWEEF